MESAAILEFHEINEYIRHAIGVYFAWFSFFLTILFGAMGWSLKAALNQDGAVKFPAMFFCMLFLFLVQLVLAVLATNAVLANVEALRARATELLALISAGGIKGYTPGTPVPAAYGGALELARAALLINAIFWPIVGIFVFHKWRSGTVVTGSAAEGH